MASCTEVHDMLVVLLCMVSVLTLEILSATLIPCLTISWQYHSGKAVDPIHFSCMQPHSFHEITSRVILCF